MTYNTTTFFTFVPILVSVLLIVNFGLGVSNPYKEKKTPFECGLHSFLSQNRTQFTITFFIFGLLFLLFDLEILVVYPITTSMSFNEAYGIYMFLAFVLVLTLGFVYELGKKALNFDIKESGISNNTMVTVKQSTIFMLIKKRFILLKPLYAVCIVVPKPHAFLYQPKKAMMKNPFFKDSP